MLFIFPVFYITSEKAEPLDVQNIAEAYVRRQPGKAQRRPDLLFGEQPVKAGAVFDAR